ncbi:hypothetical protein LS482_09560 [Sinomicrobium kalidii]|uniref:hypothetical protein n=1 Tax=Sinomicrobium kalidii TaxID=2900738 RepID=UPI001E4C9C2F|nr:hypothetical protein [Sinomicrobium kalidii]UGU18113.1 hypothetical protein LS482_09560 [Sinomicrobium kalidii]
MDSALKLLLLWAGCCMMACSTHRHRQSEMKERREARVLGFRAMSVEQLDSLSVLQVHEVGQQLEAVAIKPVGRFSYHPGSGFSGAAEKVVIYGKRHTVLDALQKEHHNHTRQERRQLQDSTHTAEAQRYEAKAVERTGTPVPINIGIGRCWWLIILVVIVLAILARVFRKHFRLWKLLRFLFPKKPK